LANVVERTEGVLIAGCFILFILTVSGVSRYWRATELRVGGHRFADAESERLWNMLVDKKVNMVPIRSLGVQWRTDRTAKLRKHYKVEGPLTFVNMNLLDNRSEFLSPLEITVRLEDGDYLVQASQAVATANAVAYLSELLHPAAIYLGLSRLNLMRQSFRYFLLGERETGLMGYTILQLFINGSRQELRRERDRTGRCRAQSDTKTTSARGAILTGAALPAICALRVAVLRFRRGTTPGPVEWRRVSEVAALPNWCKRSGSRSDPSSSRRSSA
jgi:hypothetical protein